MPLVFFFNFFFRGRPKQSSFSKPNKAFTFCYPPSPLESTNQDHHYISLKIYIIISSCTKTEHIVSDHSDPSPLQMKCLLWKMMNTFDDLLPEVNPLRPVGANWAPTGRKRFQGRQNVVNMTAFCKW